MPVNNEHSNSGLDPVEHQVVVPAGYTPTNAELWTLVQGMNDRVSTLEHRYGYIASAFPRNELNKPDYDGHRRDHVLSRKENEVVEGYKEGATKTVLNWAAVGLAAVFLAGVMDWIRTHLK